LTGRGARFSVRVPMALKAAVGVVLTQLQARGLRTSESELVELFVSDGVKTDVDVIASRLRDWRAGGER
jgi:hypothetical protein